MLPTIPSQDHVSATAIKQTDESKADNHVTATTDRSA